MKNTLYQNNELKMTPDPNDYSLLSGSILFPIDLTINSSKKSSKSRQLKGSVQTVYTLGTPPPTEE